MAFDAGSVLARLECGGASVTPFPAMECLSSPLQQSEASFAIVISSKGDTLRSRIIGAGLTFAIVTGSPAFGDVAATELSEVEAVAPKPAMDAETRPKSPFVPGDFHVPTSVDASGFKIVPLGPDVVKVDFDAYMSSIEHLQGTFTRSTAWPHKDISHADAVRDMENEQARFNNRISFAYAILTRDGSRERGSVYVQPSTVKGYDAIVRMWVTKADYDRGFDAELYKWVSEWIRMDWPFKRVAYPGRAPDWTSWDAIVAADKAGSTVAEKQNH
jgi:hypothetical protein